MPAIYFDLCPIETPDEDDPCEGCAGFSFVTCADGSPSCGAVWRERGTGRVVSTLEVARVLDPETAALEERRRRRP